MVDHQEMRNALDRAVGKKTIKYQVVGKLDEHKYKSCEGLDPNLWPKLKDKVYVLGTWPTKKWAQWCANSHREYQSSNIDVTSIKIRKIEKEQ